MSAPRRTDDRVRQPRSHHRLRLRPPVRALKMRTLARVFGLMVVLIGVVLPLTSHFLAHHDWLFTISLVALGLPGAYVFARHIQIFGVFSLEHKDIEEFHSACLQYYLSVFPVMAGIVLAQLLVPGEFKGIDAVFVLFIVLALGKFANVGEISRMYRKIQSVRRYVREPNATRKLGLTSRPLLPTISRKRKRWHRIRLGATSRH